MTDLRRICVFGAGAVGGHIAAKIAAAGLETSVVARGANLAAVKRGGFALQEGERTFTGRVRASDNPADIGTQDVVFVTTKATALAAFAQAASALCHPGTLVVFVQNGIPWWYARGLATQRPRPPDLSALDAGGALARALSPSQAIGAVVYSSNDLAAPGRIHNHSVGRNMLVVGEVDDRQTPRIAALRSLLAAAQLHSPEAADIRAAVWDKLLINFGACLCVPLGEPIAALIENARLRATRERLFAEGRAIARAHGVDPDQAPRRPGGPQSAGSTQHKPSMLQDYELGRPMEVEAILAMPCTFARAAGVEAPALEALAAVTARLAERKGLYSPS
jgi:2-dehydropantoate 2-reductase